MAVTSIWSIKGWIGKVIKYAENPDKTKENNEGQISENQSQSTQGLEDVITYAVNTEKTRRGQSESMERELVGESEELMEQYVSGVNCAPTTAREEMIAVKKRFGKEDGIVAFHGYQSFAPGECNPAMAHEIGKKLAEELWGSQYQVLIATHLDKANHLHNHFVVNSVSFLDGKRYHRTNQDYRDMRMVSDRLCKEYQLSVVQQPEQGKGKHYVEWQAEQEGNNALLILAQRLGDYGYWRDHGTYVKRMERQNPILIMEPGKTYEREDGSIGTYYNAKKLYDISQTTMTDKTAKENQYDERSLIRALVSNPPANIVAAEPDQMPDEKGAYFEPEEKCIYVRKGMDAQEIFQSLVSELVFAGYAEGNPDYDRSEDAFHAYCASYMLSKKYGMDISQFDFTHAPEFFENMEPQEVRGELSKARDAANAISGRMAKVLEQDKNLNQRQQGRAENGQKESEAKTGEQKTQEHDRGMAR